MDISDLDKALLFFYNQRNNKNAISQFKYDEAFNNLYEKRHFNSTIIIEKLVSDGLLLSNRVEPDSFGRGLGIPTTEYFVISYSGMQFYESGGYAEFERRKKKEQEFIEKKMTLELEQVQSTIDTNKSVKNVNRLFWPILLSTIIGAIGTAGTFILELRKEQQMSLPRPEGKEKVSEQTVQDSIYSQSKSKDSIDSVR